MWWVGGRPRRGNTRGGDAGVGEVDAEGGCRVSFATAVPLNQISCVRHYIYIRRCIILTA